jgi:hypothetical protein
VIGGLILLLLIKNNTPISFLLFGFIGMTASILIAVAMSFLLPNKNMDKGYTWEGMKKNLSIK